MNYYQPRQISPDADRPDAGKWRYTCMNDGQVWAVGYCAEGCPGHDDPSGAYEHQTAYVLDNARFDGLHLSAALFRTGAVVVIRCEKQATQEDGLCDWCGTRRPEDMRDNPFALWAPDGRYLGLAGGTVTGYNHQAGWGTIPADVHPTACWMERKTDETR